MTCRDCGEDFIPTPGKPGYVNQCIRCASDVPKLGGFMHWIHKTAPEIEVMPMSKARQMWSQTRRFGAGVTKSITQSKEQAHKSLQGYNPFTKDE